MPDFSNPAASVGEYLALREVCGLGRYSEGAARIGLSLGLHVVWLRDEDALVGMGRLIADPGAERLYKKHGFEFRTGMATRLS